MRTTVQNCVIGFLNSKNTSPYPLTALADDTPLQRYLASIPFVNYYVGNVLFMREYFSTLLDLLRSGSNEASKVSGKLETLTDNFYLLNDVMKCNLPLIS